MFASLKLGLLKRSFTIRKCHVCFCMAMSVVFAISATSTTYAISYFQTDFEIVDSFSPNAPPNLIHPDSNSIVHIELNTVEDGSQNGSGTMVAPNWLLTAGHTTYSPSTPTNYIINGTTYHAVSAIRPEDTNTPGIGDIGLVKLVAEDDITPANLPYVRIANPIVDGARAITIGGYGAYSQFNETTGLEDPVPPAILSGLHWGKNITTALDGRYVWLDLDLPSGPDHLDYEATCNFGDSGSGWLIPDGWEWRIMGVTYGGAARSSAATNITLPAQTAWIYSQIGSDLPTYVASPLPSANTEWQGGTTMSWSSASNWSNGIPTNSSNTWVNNGPYLSASGNSRNLFIGVGEDDFGSMTLQSGAALEVADTIYLGTESEDSGSVTQNAGIVTATREYVGYRGNGTYFHKSGTNTITETLYIGDKGGTDSAPATYTMNSSGGGNGILNAHVVIIGGESGAHGKLQINSGGTQSIAASRIIVADNGCGQFIQNGGAVNVTTMYIAAQPAADGEYELNSGSLTTKTLAIGIQGNGSFLQTSGTNVSKLMLVGASGTYTQNGGTNSIEELKVSTLGRYDLNGGTLEFRPIGKLFAQEGSVHLNGSTAHVTTGAGIIDLRSLSLIDHQNATFDVQHDSLVLLLNSNSLFANIVTNNNALPPHVSGSDLVINQHGFLGNYGSVSDRVRLGGSGYINLTPDTVVELAGGLELSGTGSVTMQTGGNPHFSIKKGITVISGTPSLRSVEGVFGDSFRVLASAPTTANPEPNAIEIQNGAQLVASGPLAIRDVLDEQDGRIVVESGGTLEIGPAVATLSLRGQLTVQSGARVLVDVTSSGSDKLKLYGDSSDAAPQLDGTLAINVSSTSLPSRGALRVIATIDDALEFDGHFAKVAAGLNGTITSGIIIDTVPNEWEDDLAMAVLYPKDFEAFEIDPTSVECSTGDCVVVRATLPGDFDGDNDVDAADYLDHFFLNYNQSGAFTYTDGDLDGDGDVDAYDYSAFFPYYGLDWDSGLVGGEVPEPASIGIFAVVLFGCVGFARTRHCNQ